MGDEVAVREPDAVLETCCPLAVCWKFFAASDVHVSLAGVA